MYISDSEKAGPSKKRMFLTHSLAFRTGHGKQDNITQDNIGNMKLNQEDGQVK